MTPDDRADVIGRVLQLRELFSMAEDVGLVGALSDFHLLTQIMQAELQREIQKAKEWQVIALKLQRRQELTPVEQRLMVAAEMAESLRKDLASAASK
jgi:hypothetical protein